MRREIGTQIPPQGGIFWIIIFYNLKNSSQDLSYEGSNFILSSLEVGQTWAFFDKLPEIMILAPYKNLRKRHDSEFAKF